MRNSMERVTRWALASLALIMCVVGVAQGFTWDPCDVGKVPFTPAEVLLTPDPPAAGGSVTFKIKGDAGAARRQASYLRSHACVAWSQRRAAVHAPGMTSTRSTASAAARCVWVTHARTVT